MVEFDEYGETRRVAVLNLTQHSATTDQIESGVVDLQYRADRMTF